MFPLDLPKDKILQCVVISFIFGFVSSIGEDVAKYAMHKYIGDTTPDETDED